MPTDILLMLGAFAIGSLFEYGVKQAENIHQSAVETKIRPLIYKVVVIYLLFKIGFTGGQSVITQPLSETLNTGLLVVVGSIIWTLFILQVLKAWSRFNHLTQISIAAHFGSVSVGTFIAGIAFLQALNISVPASVAIWLALMELPAILVAMWKLNISFKKVFDILKKDYSLLVLIAAIIWGTIGASVTPSVITNALTGTIFLSVLTYFLFEMGRKALAAAPHLKNQLKQALIFGIFIPILGGFAGSAIGFLLNYSLGETFIIALLFASASYVLAPISLYEVFKNLAPKQAAQATQAVATSMALSVGITLPFNILIGFELYYLYIKSLSVMPQLSLVGLFAPFIIYIVAISVTLKQKNITKF